MRNRDSRAFVEPAAAVEPLPWPDGLPEAGIYYDVPEAEYRAWPAISQSSLKYGLQTTMKHLRAKLNGMIPDADSPARRLGRVIHCGILEPANFGSKFKIAKPCQAVIATGARKGKACGTASRFLDDEGMWFCGTHAKGFRALEQENICTDYDMQCINAIRSQLKQHEVVHLLRARGGSEVSFTTSLLGVPVKGRCDRFAVGDEAFPPTAIDLKKVGVGKGSDEDLQRTISQFGYDLQATLYTTALAELIGKPVAWVWLFVEDGPPFDVIPKQASGLMLKLGQVKLRLALESYAWCVRTKTWPGYSSSLDTIDPAHWDCFRWGVTEEVGG